MAFGHSWQRAGSRERGAETGEQGAESGEYGILRKKAVLIGIFVSVLALVGGAFAGQLIHQERRGKQIYIKTTSPSGGEIKAIVGASRMEAPGAALPCVNCHARDGRGLIESGVTASNITWTELTKSYGVRHFTGREHPAYTEDTLAKAVTEGVDPAGNVLDVAMPRYSMPKQDLADLIAYLKALEIALDPGLSESTVRLGTFLPTQGRFGELGRAMRDILAAYVAEINAKGGIYNRKIELLVSEVEGSPASVAAAAQRMIDAEETFALVSPFVLGADREMAELVEAAEIPLVGPFTLFPADAASLSRFTFYLFSGLGEQVRAFVDFAATELQLPSPRGAILYPEYEIPPEILDGIREQAKKRGWPAVEAISHAPAGLDSLRFAQQLKKAGTTLLIFLGTWDDLMPVLAAGAGLGWTPYVFLPGTQAKREVLEAHSGFDKRIFLSYPSLPSDHTQSGAGELGGLFQRHGLSRGNLPAQISAYCAAKILVEGMKLAGRDLSREKLVTRLERLYNFETGLTPPISYGPNRRIGALGAYMVTVDLQKREFVPVSKWITPE